MTAPARHTSTALAGVVPGCATCDWYATWIPKLRARLAHLEAQRATTRFPEAAARFDRRIAYRRNRVQHWTHHFTAHLAEVHHRETGT